VTEAERARVCNDPDVCDELSNEDGRENGEVVLVGRTEARGMRATPALALCALAFLLAAAFSPAALAAGPEAHATKIGAAPAGQELGLVLPLRADFAGLQRLARAITDRSSPQYGQYESVSQLEARFGAPASERSRVVQYLRSHGAGGVKIDATGLFADATMTVGLAQRLFGTQLNRFRTASDAQYVSPAAQARVPAPVRGIVTGVLGLDTKPLAGDPASALRKDAHTTSANSIRSGTPIGCAPALATTGFTPNQYLTAYGYQTLRTAGMSGQNERVALIEIDGFRVSDVHTFARCFGLSVPRINTFGVGIKKRLKPGAESTLDLEVLDSVAPNLKAIDVYESGSTSADVIKSLSAPLQNSGSKPQVISASLSVCEPALFTSLKASGIEAAEGSLELAAASGISILSASGDSGSSACIGPDGPIAEKAINYPASSWWVTGVGGTNATLSSANALLTQVAWNDAPNSLGAGGGGLSLLFKRPGYQKSFVPQNVRGVPDVSMLADVAPGFAIFCSVRGECLDRTHPDPWLSVGGTSAATPLLAGGIAIIDQDLRTHGRQDLGLANPLLYKVDRSAAGPLVFSDVTQGDIDLGPFLPSGQMRPLGCCTAGVGYDLATGLGTVNVAGLAAAASNSQPKIVNVGLSLPRNQHALSHGRMLATVSCSGQCLMASFATVKAGRKSFLVRSHVFLLRRKNRKTIPLPFSKGQSKSLRSSRGGSATVFGVILDAGGNIEKQSRGIKLQVTS
jgi:subtilase family serine protease